VSLQLWVQQYAKSPSVFPLKPCCGTQDSSISIGCLASGYLPQTLSIKWNAGAIQDGIMNFPPISNGDLYTSSSQLTISASDWKNKPYSCTVEHLNKTIEKQGRVVILKPSMYLFGPHAEELKEANDSYKTLICLIKGLFPKDIYIQWKDRESPISEDKYKILNSEPLLYNGNLYIMVSMLTIPSENWTENHTYSCHSYHWSGTRSEYIVDNINCLGINVFILGPTVEDLLVNKIAPLTCLASNLPSSTGYKFTWLQEGGGNLPFTTEDPTLNENGTYSVASVCSTTIDAWDKGTKYTCTLTYTGITSPFIKIISKGTEDNMSPPIVALFPPTSEEESSKEYVTYTCMASNFYPIDIYIGWSQDNQEIHKSLYVNSDPTWEVENASYFIVSKLKVPYEDWKENKAVSCVVGHKALPLHFIQRTIDKTTGKPTKTFVNIYMSDSNLSCP
uniref:Ig-like domain-containing protein n=1 Tax=Leptobrachium leishanense TaxID=445787 RepID=A0A8C5MDW7_9ANUR